MCKNNAWTVQEKMNVKTHGNTNMGSPDGLNMRQFNNDYTMCDEGTWIT